MPSFEKSASSGLWSCRFREIDENGVQKNRRLSGFKTKREAQHGYEDYVTEKAERDERRKLERAAEADAAELTFDQLLAMYYEYEKPRVKESSFYDIEKKIATNIVPFFAGRKIKDIKPADVLKWQSTLAEFSYNYKKHLQTLLTSVFRYGERYHDIPNVMKKVEKPRRLTQKKEMLFWTPQELALAIDTIAEEKYRVFFSFLFFSGCREGEAFALTWDDLDLQRGIVNIDKSLTRKAHDGDKPYKITPPKNDASYRRVPIPTELCIILAVYKANEHSSGKLGTFVFGGDRPLSLSTCERRLTAAAKAAGVKRIRIHDLRHSCATYLIHKKVSIVTVSRHLGHSDVTQTLNTYAHAMPDDHDELLAVLNQAAKRTL
jgi:integrase